MICEGCVFYKEDRERGIDICGKRDESFEAIRACIRADYYESCFEKMDRAAVLKLSREVASLKAERDQALITLAKADEYIEAVQRMIDNLRSVNSNDEKRILS